MSSVSPTSNYEQEKSLFHKLPTELLNLSLNFLEDPKDIVSASKTCKVFYKSLKDIREIFKSYKDLIGTVFDSWKDIKRLPEQNFFFEKFDITNSEYCLERFLYPIMRGKTPNGKAFIAFRYNIKDQDGKIEDVAISILCTTSNDNCWQKSICFQKKDPDSYRHSHDPIFHDMHIIIINNNKPDIVNRIGRLIKRKPIGNALSEAVPNTKYFGGWAPPYIYQLYENPRTITKDGRPIVELVEEIKE